MCKENISELAVLTRLDESKEILEHTRGSARGGDEFRKLVELLVGIEDGRHHADLLLIETQNAIAKGGRAYQLDILSAS